MTLRWTPRFSNRPAALVLPAAAALLIGACAPAATPARAQTAAAAAPSAAGDEARAAANAFDDVRILLVLEPLKLTSDQIRQTLPLVESARQLLDQADQENRRSLEQARAELEGVRTRLASGQSSAERQRQYVENLQSRGAARRAQAEVRALQTIERVGPLLSVEQRAAWEAVAGHERAAALEAAARSGGAPDRLASGEPVVPPGKQKTMGKMLEKLRGAAPDVFPREAEKFARRFARDLPPDSPAYTQRVQEFMGVANRVRNLTDSELQAGSGAALARQLAAREHLVSERAEGLKNDAADPKKPAVARRQPEKMLPGRLREALLHPRAAVVLRQLAHNGPASATPP